jgi:hypothetical protein
MGIADMTGNAFDVGIFLNEFLEDLILFLIARMRSLEKKL